MGALSIPRLQGQPFQSQCTSREADANASPRRSRRKYIFTDQIDQLIREFYLSRPDSKTRPGIRLLAKKVGIPHWTLKKRARELGLARTKESAWSEPELVILARCAWMSDERLRLKLKAVGYTRTATAIHLKLKRMAYKKGGDFYSAHGLAQALGIDAHAVTRWINHGRLKASLRGTARGERQNGDIYLIREKDVRRFVLEHPSEIDLRKVDQLWFLDYVEYDGGCPAEGGLQFFFETSLLESGHISLES
jgi:hypothetical protein